MLCTLSFNTIDLFYFSCSAGRKSRDFARSRKRRGVVKLNSELLPLLIYMHHLLYVIFTFSIDAQAVL